MLLMRIFTKELNQSKYSAYCHRCNIEYETKRIQKHHHACL